MHAQVNNRRDHRPRWSLIVDSRPGSRGGTAGQTRVGVKPLTRQTWRYAVLGLVLWGLGLSPVTGVEASKRAISVVPDEERRSVIQEADGYASLGEDQTISQMRALAFINAKRRVLEKAKTRITSSTKLKNFQLEYDVVMTQSEGAITILEEKDYGIQNHRYHVWIKAEVDFALQPKGGGSSSGLIMDAAAPLTVKVWTDQKSYRAGDEITVLVEGNRDFYARVLNISSEDSIVQILPNAYHTSDHFMGGRTYRIPGDGDPFKLQVQPPYGLDKIVVYASESPLGNVSMQEIGGGLKLYQGTQREIARDSRRGVGVVSRSQPASPGASFYEATWTFTTRP